MYLVDKDIYTFLNNGSLKETKQTAIYDGDYRCVSSVGYDLRANGFVNGDRLSAEFTLEPSSSVIVESREIIHFDELTCGVVNIKNSRLRQGLSLEAPVHQPGHTTKIYFRLTNLSDKVINLYAGEMYAMLLFEQLHDSPEHSYQGTFQGETDYTGLAGYHALYKDQVEQL